MSENIYGNYVLFFCNWAMGTMSESCYDNPYQGRCVGIICDVKMSKMYYIAHTKDAR